MKGKVKVLYKGKGINKRYFKTLYLNGFEWNEIIKSFRQIDLFDKKLKKEENEIFLSIETEKGNFYFYVVPTEEFKGFLRKKLFSYPTYEPSIEIIQQRAIVRNKEKWLKKCLVLVNEGNFIGDVWLDYKPLKEVLDFFKVKWKNGN